MLKPINYVDVEVWQVWWV